MVRVVEWNEWYDEMVEGVHREVALGPKEPILELVSGNCSVEVVDGW